LRYLRMLSNSVIAGGLASGYLTVVVLQLNPSYPIDPGTLALLALALAAAYGVNLTVAFYALIVFRQILAVEVLSPGWLSVRLLSWLSVMAATGGAALMWLNLDGFGPVLDEETTRRMMAGAIVVSASAALFLLVALAHIGRRGGGVSAAVLVAGMALSVAIPVVLRGPGRPAPLPARPTVAAPEAADQGTGARVTLLMFDGASVDIIAPAVAEGRLPNLGRIFDAGAVLPLATLRPTQAETVWSAVATGRSPMQNGVRSSAAYRLFGRGPEITLLPDFCFAQALVRFGFLQESRHSSADLAARPVWSILSDLGVPVGIVGWPLTHPAPPVLGVLVSEVLHRMSDAQMDLEGAHAVSPPTLLADVRAALALPASPDPVDLLSDGGGPPAGDYDVASDPQPVTADRVHLQLLSGLGALSSSRLTAVRFPGVDAVGHYFLRYADPSAFGDVTEPERRRFGRVLDRYYGFIDTVVGASIAKVGPDDLLLVVSAFGMEPLTPGKRLLERLVGNPEISGTHERAPDGFVLAFGPSVQPGRPPRASVMDLTPTILYYLGHPVARDMEGSARTDLFRSSFTAERPVTYIPTYGR
jgi:hypothetical protein